MPTGGVEQDPVNLRAWFDAGVSAVGMGSKLLTKPIIETGAFAELTSHTEEVLKQITAIRHS
jgi:2-dehydro-3-deoxyphosphogluconate aldolase/(4S)-4-hydroxy-2-oxoglutarate aldolase